MELNNNTIRELLLKGNYISAEDMKVVDGFLSKRKEADIVDVLISKELLTKDLLGQAVAEAFGIIYADLNTNVPTREDVLKVPEDVGRKYRAVLYDDQKTQVVVATDRPDQSGLKSELKNIFRNKKIVLAYGLPEDIDESLVHYRQPLQTRFQNIIEKSERIAPEVVVEIIDDAIVDRASDIHFEPQEDDVLIRLRIDGVMHEAARIGKQYYDNMLNLIKVNAHMRIDEHAAAQDGSMRIKKGNKRIDMRVSIMPTLDGEKITIRVLSEYVKRFSLSDVGLSEEDQDLLLDASRRPFGMILVSGPTGSGKTSTLYSLLRTMNNPEVNITTIEDPVEYKITGVNHVQVNPQTELTFAKGLRSIVRQDPDIILVGEIRDQETAEIAVNAALTGHLLLSTFHANDAATAIPRLLDMGVESFLLASTMELLLSQRLVRKLCSTCRVSKVYKSAVLIKHFPFLKNYFTKKEVTLYEPKEGCDACGGSGYQGRTGIFELINMTRNMKDLILTNPSTTEIWDEAVKSGSHAMFDDGIKKVLNGVTSLEELLRVAHPADYNPAKK